MEACFGSHHLASYLERLLVVIIVDASVSHSSHMVATGLDESSYYSHDPHMMRAGQYVFRSLNSYFMLLIKLLFCVQITELENRF
jgi:hypothetical protein